MAHFDRAIPPGGEGKVTLKVNLKGFQGKISKAATIYSNDPQTPEFTVKVEGTVQPLIEVKPSANVIFRGMSDQLSEMVVELSGVNPFHISDIQSDSGENFSYKLDTIEEGKTYKLIVNNKCKRGNYAGFIKLVTDQVRKPDVLIRVNGFIEGEVSVKPQTILIGKLSASQPERPGRILVTSNRNKPFQITRLTYDEQFLSIKQESLEKEGFSLEVNPKLDSVPAGTRKQVSVTIETDAAPGEKDVVQVHLFNSTDQPAAQPQPK